MYAYLNNCLLSRKLIPLQIMVFRAQLAIVEVCPVESLCGLGKLGVINSILIIMAFKNFYNLVHLYIFTLCNIRTKYFQYIKQKFLNIYMYLSL